MSNSPDDLLQELMQTFQAEAAEHLGTLNQTLLRLERQADKAKQREGLQEAFRTAHSLKGAARAVGLTAIERLAHGLEDVLKLAREDRLTLDPNACDTLYHALDLIKRLLEGEAPDIEASCRQLAALTGQPVLEFVAPVEPEPVNEHKPEETVRVAISKLDALMAQAGELLVSKISAEQRLDDIQRLHRQIALWGKTWREIKTLLPRIHDEGDSGRRQLTEVLTAFYQQQIDVIHEMNRIAQASNRDTMRLGMVASGLQAQVRRVRMVPFQTLTPGFERAVRDVAHSQGKTVDFHVVGGEVELDKRVLDSLKDPLLHLLRNAVTHGIEDPQTRQRAGKSPHGCVTLSAQQRGSEVRLKVEDNGGGFDLSALRGAAARGGVSIDDNAPLDEVLALAFLPGITTAGELTSIAGRGIGLDVVRQKLDELQGRIIIDNQPGKGASLHLIVPVSLSMTRALLIEANGQCYGLPLVSVERILEPRDVFTVGGQTMLNVNGTPLPLVPLAAILNVPQSGEIENPVAIIIGSAEQRLALLVDDVLTEQELAVKPLGNPLRHARNVSGAALLGNGDPVVILSATDLIKSAKGVRAHADIQTPLHDETPEEKAHILVVDDSITTRTLEKNILEAAGYTVFTATDGVEAVRRLKENDVDLVVTDIQMPNMDGISLTRYLRDQGDNPHLPIILVTSLESRQDREQGMIAGANAYIVKRGFNQAELLATIQQLL